MGPGKILCILTPQSPLSWVSESFRQDICSLSKSFSRFQLGKFKVFLTKNIFIIKNLTDFRKALKPVCIRAWSGADQELVLTVFLLLGRSGGHGSSGNFLILTPQSPLSWVSESFRQDIYLLSKSLCRFNLESLKFFTKNIFIMKNLTNFCKTVRPVWIRAWKLTEYSRSSRGQLLCIY